jgi:hypothetical protein
MTLSREIEKQNIFPADNNSRINESQPEQQVLNLNLKVAPDSPAASMEQPLGGSSDHITG